MQMRTIAEAYQELKKQDPNTALTLYALQTLIKNGAIPSVCIGKKRLVNLQTVTGYLQGEIKQIQPQTVSYGQMRAVNGVK